MKAFLAILLFISIILESTIIPFPLTLLCLLLFVHFLESQIVFFSFFTGLLLDVFSLYMWGVSSVFFLVTVFVLSYYRRKFHQEGSFIYQLLFIFLFIALYGFFFYHYFRLKELIFVLVLEAVFLFIFKRLFPYRRKKGKLAV